MTARAPAPIVHDARRLALAVLHRLDTQAASLSRRVCQVALALVEALTLAASGRDRARQLDAADRHLVLLRAHLRLAADAALLTDEQLVPLLELADGVGRQLGGWRKSTGADLEPPPE